VTPPDSTKAMFLGRAVDLVPADALWDAIIVGKIRVYAYAVGQTDLGPVPISPLELQAGDRTEIMRSYQVEVVDRDQRRPARRRRRIPVPHWLYVVKADLPQVAPESGSAPFRKIDAAKLGVSACYPGGVPPTVANATMNRRVGTWLKENFPDLGEISDDTIERAAGRK
jgi:hypothetical protein